MTAMFKLLLSLSALIVYVQSDVETIRNLVIEKGLDPRQVVNLEGRLYFINTYKETYYAMMSLCNDIRMVLVSIESEHEEQLLANHIVENGFALDGYATSGTSLYNRWLWSGAGQEMTYTNWAPGEPDFTGTSTCVSMHISRNAAVEWRDESCITPNYVICEQNANFCTDNCFRQYLLYLRENNN